MAEDLNMYQPDLSDLENNKPGCGIKDLAKLEMIASYLNISLSYLLFGDGDEAEGIWEKKELCYSIELVLHFYLFDVNTYIEKNNEYLSVLFGRIDGGLSYAYWTKKNSEGKYVRW